MHMAQRAHSPSLFVDGLVRKEEKARDLAPDMELKEEHSNRACASLSVAVNLYSADSIRQVDA